MGVCLSESLVYKSGDGLPLGVNPARRRSGSTGLTVDDRRVDNNAGQVGVGHGFVQDEASDAGTSTQGMSDQRKPLTERGHSHMTSYGWAGNLEKHLIMCLLKEKLKLG